MADCKTDKVGCEGERKEKKKGCKLERRARDGVKLEVSTSNLRHKDFHLCIRL